RLERRAGRDLATHHTDRQSAEAGRDDRAPDLADVVAAVVDQLRAGRRRIVVSGTKAAQMTVHVSAKVHAGDDFLPDVAALGVRDRTEVVEVGFLWNRRVVDVDAPFGTAGFDARDFPGGETRRRGARLERATPERVEQL